MPVPRTSSSSGNRRARSGRAAAAELEKGIDAALRRAGTAERAQGARAYLKHELEHYGADARALREALRPVLRLRDLDRSTLLDLARRLWDRPVFERRAAAAELLARRSSLLGARDVPFIETLLRDSGTWALVDTLSPQVMGPLVERHPRLHATLERWSGDPDFWIRRAALLAHLVPLRRGEGDFTRFTALADPLLEDREFFVRKAIGWVLRERGKKRAGEVHRWLLPRAHRASGVTVREAVKYLETTQSDAILARHRTGKARTVAAANASR
jgi:3-methyladenine DNA glycosylase AlkD